MRRTRAGPGLRGDRLDVLSVWPASLPYVFFRNRYWRQALLLAPFRHVTRGLVAVGEGERGGNQGQGPRRLWSPGGQRPPPAGRRVLVEREFSKILPGLICDWTIEIRLQSAGLLKTLLEYCEAKCARPSPCFLLSCILMLLFSSVRLFTRCSPRFGHPLTPPRPPTAAAPCCGS